MKIKNKTISYSFGGSICAATLLLTAFGVSAQSQNMFVGGLTSGTIVEFPTSGPQSTFATGLNNPNSLAFNSAGDLFEGDQSSGNIYEYAPGGGAPTTFATGLNQPTSLAFDQAGDLFVGTENNNVLEYSVHGGAPTPFVNSGLSTPSALAFDTAGDLFIANEAGDGAGTGYITEIAHGGGQSTFASNLTNPSALAFNSMGNLFVAEGNPQEILEYSGGTPSTYATGLNDPIGLAFDNAGDLFVTDAGYSSETGDITEFPASGPETVFSTSVSKPVSIAFQPVPEPSSFGLLGAGVMALLARRPALRNRR